MWCTKSLTMYKSGVKCDASEAQSLLPVAVNAVDARDCGLVSVASSSSECNAAAENVHTRQNEIKMHTSEISAAPAEPHRDAVSDNCIPRDDLLRALASTCASTTFGVYAQQ